VTIISRPRGKGTTHPSPSSSRVAGDALYAISLQQSITLVSSKGFEVHGIPKMRVETHLTVIIDGFGVLGAGVLRTTFMMDHEALHSTISVR
jgi:hypothetical protein